MRKHILIMATWIFFSSGGMAQTPSTTTTMTAVPAGGENEKPVLILGPRYPGLIEPNGEGRYQKNVRAALQGQNVEIEERILPVKRALLSFLEADADCIYSMTLPVQNAAKPGRVILSPMLSKTKLFIFQRKGSPPVVSVKSIPEKTHIGGVLGNEAYYQASEKQGHVLEYVTEDQLNIEKLRYRRLSYIYGFFPNLDAYRDELSFNEKHPILEIPDSITCYDNPRTRKFIAVLDHHLKKVVESQSLSQKQANIEKSKQIKMWILKDLLTDLSPPPLFIIESHLLSLQAILEVRHEPIDVQRIAGLQANALALEAGKVPARPGFGFQERQSFWKTKLAEAAEFRDLWGQFEKGPLASAKKYMDVQRDEFFPALASQNLLWPKRSFPKNWRHCMLSTGDRLMPWWPGS